MTLSNGMGGWGSVIRDYKGEVVAVSNGKAHFHSFGFIELEVVEQEFILA